MSESTATSGQRQRLDTLLVELGLAESREKARALIMAGSVLLDDQPATKPGQMAPAGSRVRVKDSLPYVSRGGLKLEAALDAFAVDPAGLVVADVGASTGGFSDCLLQRGAAHVYAIDVGYGQLAWQLRQDSRMTSLERTNVRNLPGLPGGVRADLAVVDVSFIGLDLVLPAVARLLQPDGQAIVLIKPQFEAGKAHVGKGGVVRDPAVHRHVLARVLAWATGHGWVVAGLIRSPITGPKGNIEFLALLRRVDAALSADFGAMIETVLAPDLLRQQ
jgi:23S rRNA (cytidine1920-2'-O)/16S rRNA (cytidine1409-2'-O)-methyltransferase